MMYRGNHRVWSEAEFHIAFHFRQVAVNTDIFNYILFTNLNVKLRSHLPVGVVELLPAVGARPLPHVAII
jgi:hypothetical protein